MWITWLWVRVATHVLWHAFGKSEDNLEVLYHPLPSLLPHGPFWGLNSECQTCWQVLWLHWGTLLASLCFVIAIIFVIYGNEFHKKHLFQVYHIFCDCSTLIILFLYLLLSCINFLKLMTQFPTNNIILCIYTYHFFLHLSVDRHIGW